MNKQNEMMKKSASVVTKWIGSTTSVILHTVLFIISFILPYIGIVPFERMLLVLTTVVSLEAIYLSIFIQMSLNLNSENIEILQEDVDEIGENIEEIQEEINDDDDDDSDDDKKELLEELTTLSKKIGGLSPKARQIIVNRINEIKKK
jgi:low affinity Fe/Cu permease